MTCDVVAGAVDLVRAPVQHAVEDVAAEGDEPGVGHPGAVEAVVGLALLVEPHLGERRPVGLRVVAGDVGGHAADGVRAALVAGAHEQFGVGAHERRRHGDLRPVGEGEVGAVREDLDQAEEVVPAARVEPGTVLAQLVEDLLHLERRGDRLDQDGGADRAPRDAEQILGEDEHVVPQPGLVGVLQLGEVEVRAVSGVDLPLCAVEEVQAEVDERGGHGAPVDEEVLFGEVPAARAHDDGRELARRAGTPCRRASVKSIRRSMASSRFSWPPMTLSQVGEVASSKSASHTWAPELSALMVIRRSGGPVISTRRSARPGAGGATRQCGSARTAEVASEKSSGEPDDEAKGAAAALGEDRRGPVGEGRWRGGR